MRFGPPATTASCDSAVSTATTASPSILSASSPVSYPCAASALKSCSSDLGTLRSAAVPIAPTLGGKP
jgi:hypothetical protein